MHQDFIYIYDQIPSSQVLAATFEISMKFLKGIIGSTATENNRSCTHVTVLEVRFGPVGQDYKQHTYNIPLPTVKLVKT